MQECVVILFICLGILQIHFIKKIAEISFAWEVPLPFPRKENISILKRGSYAIGKRNYDEISKGRPRRNFVLFTKISSKEHSFPIPLM